MNTLRSRGFNDCENEDKLVISINCESEPIAWSLIREIKTFARLENLKRKQAGGNRLEYKISYSSSANTVS